MLTKSTIRQRLGETPEIITDDHFIKMHIGLEGYLKWIFMVGLRLKGCAYAPASRVIQKHFIRLNVNSFKAAFKLLGVKKSWHHIKANDKKLRELETLCLKYTSPIRNQLVHGNYYAFKEDELKLVYDIDKAFINALENAVKQYCKGNSILNNTPTQFGAKKGTITNENQIGQILNQSPGLKPMRFTDAQKKFEELL